MLQNQPKLNLLEYQKKALDDIFIAPAAKTPEWKILILDQSSRLILQNFYTVKDLRENLITLQLMINQDRSSFPGVTAVYFVEASNENIQIILQDAKEDFYSSVEIHFISDPGSDTIPIMAKTLAKEAPKYVKGIKKIDYVNVNFHSVDKNIALLPTYNELASLISNLEYPPVFIYQPEQQSVVDNTRKKLAAQRHNPHRDNTQYCIAVLIVSRDIDYEPVFLHDTSYSSLMIDTCEVSGLNKLKIGNDVVALDSKNETWSGYKHQNIGEVTKKLESDLEMAKAKNKDVMEKMSKYKESNDKNILGDENIFKDNEVKKIQSSLSILKKVLDRATSRRLSEFCWAEEEVLLKKKLSEQKKVAEELLRNPNIYEQDKIRFMIIYMLNSQSLSSLAELQKLIENVKKPKIYTQVRSLLKPVDRGDGRFNFVKDKVMGTMGTLLNAARTNPLNFLMKSSSKLLNLTKMVMLIVDKGIEGVKEESKMMVAQSKSACGVRGVLVYVVGGIDYKEHNNLMSSTNINIIYAGDKIAKAGDMIKV